MWWNIAAFISIGLLPLSHATITYVREGRLLLKYETHLAVANHGSLPHSLPRPEINDSARWWCFPGWPYAPAQIANMSCRNVCIALTRLQVWAAFVQSCKRSLIFWSRSKIKDHQDRDQDHWKKIKITGSDLDQLQDQDQDHFSARIWGKKTDYTNKFWKYNLNLRFQRTNSLNYLSYWVFNISTLRGNHSGSCLMQICMFYHNSMMKNWSPNLEIVDQRSRSILKDHQ